MSQGETKEYPAESAAENWEKSAYTRLPHIEGGGGADTTVRNVARACKTHGEPMPDYYSKFIPDMHALSF